MSEPTVWVEIPADWVVPQGQFTFLRDGTRGLAFGPVLAIEPDGPATTCSCHTVPKGPPKATTRDVIATSVREHFRVRLGSNTLANIRASADPGPIPLSGGEADTIALLSLQALKDAGYTLYRPVDESEDTW